MNSFVDVLPTSHDVGCYHCCCFSAVCCTRDSSPVFYILVELSKFGTALILYQCNHSTLLLLNANLSIWQLVLYKVDLCLWRFPWCSGSPCLPWDCTSPLASLFRMANLFLRHHSKLPTLRLTKSLGHLWIYLLLRDLTMSPSHLLNMSAPGAYHEIDNLLVALWIGVGMICACTCNAYLHQYLTLLQLRKVAFMMVTRQSQGIQGADCNIYCLC